MGSGHGRVYSCGMIGERGTALNMALDVIHQIRVYVDRNDRRAGTRIMRREDILPEFNSTGEYVEVPLEPWHMHGSDPKTNESTHRMLKRLVSDAMRQTRILDGSQRWIARIPLKKWNRYANQIIKDEAGARRIYEFSEDGFDHDEFKLAQKTLPESEFCKRVIIMLPRDIAKDDFHPCGLATCTKVITDPVDAT